MDSQQSQYSVLVKALLPEDLFDYFEITDVRVFDKSIDVYLDEKNQPSDTLKGQKLSSKGFYPSVTIQDFPIRERAVFLHVRRRKWLVEQSGKIVSNDWDAMARGTRYTKGFATFLKELLG